ncbi:MAG: sensor histidine kinase [Longimicrobiales bacterium]
MTKDPGRDKGGEPAELRKLVDQLAEGLLALTEDGRISRINAAAKKILGLDDVELLSPLASVVRDSALLQLLEASTVRKKVRAEVRHNERELQVRTRRSKGGGSVVLLTDVTEIRRLEAVRTDFVANASHELKTPLTVIRAAAETVLDGDIPEDLRNQFLRSIHGNAVRLQRLVEDLLDLSRFESGAWEPVHTLLDVPMIAAAVWRDMGIPARVKPVRFVVEGEGQGIGDEAALYQILQNLLGNAVRYVPDEDGQIRVGVVRRDGFIEVAVADNGAGIPEEALSRVFERFYRVDGARSRQEGGTGLGLAIVRHLVTTMGGNVWAESTEGAGTTIRFTLPAGEVPVHESEGTPAQVSETSGAAPSP